jgi:hypothetical protein
MADNIDKPDSASKDKLPVETGEKRLLRVKEEEIAEMKANTLAAEAFLKTDLCQKNENLKLIFTALVEANNLILQIRIATSISVRMENVVSLIECCKQDITEFTAFREEMMRKRFKLTVSDNESSVKKE